MSFKKSLFKNILTLGGYNYGSQLASFLSSIVLARLLMPEEYGYVALITVFTGFITLFADAGLSFSVIRSDYGRTFNRATTNLSFYIGLLLFIITVIMAWPIAYFYDDKTLVLPTIIISFNYIFGAFKIVPMAILSKELKFNYVGKVRLISNLISIFFMILFALLGFSYWSLIIPILFVQLVQYIMFENRVRLGFKLYRFSYTIIAFRKTKSLLISLSGANLINYWAANADNLIIGKFYSNYELGIYDKAYKMLQLSLSIIVGLFNTVLYPSLKKFMDSGGKINPQYDSVLGIISLINFPVVAVLILFPNTIVRVLWGENWLLVADYLPYFGLMIVYHTLLATTGQIFILLEKEKVMMKIAIFGDIARIIAMIIGSFYSVEGIIIARLLSFFILIIPLNLYVGFIKIFGYNWKYILSFWVPKISLGVLILIALWFDYEGWLPYLIVIYFMHILFYQKNDIRKLMGMILERIKKK